jgi:hypothetical protein
MDCESIAVWHLALGFCEALAITLGISDALTAGICERKALSGATSCSVAADIDDLRRCRGEPTELRLRYFCMFETANQQLILLLTLLLGGPVAIMAMLCILLRRAALQIVPNDRPHPSASRRGT